MLPADTLPPEQLIGRRVVFNTGPDHADCWHSQYGLTQGVVLRRAQTRSQKAALFGAEWEPPEESEEEEAALRLWVRANPCAAFARGCETAVPVACLLVLEPGEQLPSGN